MELLKERIRREGKVLPGNIIKVDGFLNHRVDTALMSQLADEFAKYFDVNNITMVLTAEASGIAPETTKMTAEISATYGRFLGRAIIRIYVIAKRMMVNSFMTGLLNVFLFLSFLSRQRM